MSRAGRPDDPGGFRHCSLAHKAENLRRDRIDDGSPDRAHDKSVEGFLSDAGRDFGGSMNLLVEIAKKTVHVILILQPAR